MKGESPRGNPEFAGEAKWSASWWAPRSRAGSFIGGESLGRGQLDLAPGWTGWYENQMTIMIITRIRLHLALQMPRETLSLAKQPNPPDSVKVEGMFCTKYSSRSITKKYLQMIPYTHYPSADSARTVFKKPGPTQILLDKHSSRPAVYIVSGLFNSTATPLHSRYSSVKTHKNSCHWKIHELVGKDHNLNQGFLNLAVHVKYLGNQFQGPNPMSPNILMLNLQWGEEYRNHLRESCYWLASFKKKCIFFFQREYLPS